LHAMCNQLKARCRSLLSRFASRDVAQALPAVFVRTNVLNLHNTLRRESLSRCILFIVFSRELAEMGVPLSKYRVLQSCLDIHCVVSPSENGNPMATARSTSLKRPSFGPKTTAESIVEKPKQSSNVCNLLTPNSRTSLSESVTFDAESSIRSPEHTRTLNCWRSAQPESIGESSGGIFQEPTEVEEEQEEGINEEECAICSSTFVVTDDVITVLDDSLVVEIHAVRPDSDNEEHNSGQFLLRPYRPDKTLFQPSPHTVRLETLDGYNILRANNNHHLFSHHFTPY
jgi:hypothetical protein